MEFHHHLVEILFMERILHQLIGILSVHSIIYKVLYITGRNMFWIFFFPSAEDAEVSSQNGESFRSVVEDVWFLAHLRDLPWISLNSSYELS